MVSIPLLPKTDSLLSSSPNYSRWASINFLIDDLEMQALFKELAPFHLLSSTPLDSDLPFYLKQEKFLEIYHYYIDSLRQGKIPDPKVYKFYFIFFISRSLTDIHRMQVLEGVEVLKIVKPTLLIKPICFQYSKMDHSLRVVPLNPEGILWGLQVSFPQLIQKANSNEIEPINPKIDENALVFKTFRQWIRSHTSPQSFEILGKKQSPSIRLGHHCHSWIAHHPQLLLHPEIKIL
jgi:hypothetical protein